MSTHEDTHGPAARPSAGRLRSARRLSQRKQRLQTGLFLAEGPQAVREALAYHRAREVFFVAGADRIHHLVADAVAGGVPAYEISAGELDQLTDTVHPQGIAAVCEWRPTEISDLPAHPKLIVACAQVRDPGNAGTVIRCADAFGADAVLVSEDSVEITNPKVVRASVGSVFHLPVVTGVHLENALGDLRDRGMQVLAAEGSGTASLEVMAAAGELARPTVWLMGNEAWGLPAEHVALADQAVAVPIWGQAESLNLATAAAVCLYATASAQRRVG